MATSKSKRKYNLVCIAHPDDETIFFGGLILQEKKTSWTVVCVTSDGSALRKKQFARACKALGVEEVLWWSYPDKYSQRLPVQEITARLQELDQPQEIYTHGIIGEYGHPHHQDVSYAVHSAFPMHKKLYSSAHNTFPEKEILLSPKQFSLKSHILTKIYGSETNRFLNVLPSTFAEGFRRVDLEEIETVYDFLARKKSLRLKKLNAYAWLAGYLPYLRDLPRPF